MLYGAPRSGKTTLCKALIERWRVENQIGVLKRVSGDSPMSAYNNAKKFILDRMNVVIDGGCHTEVLRTPYIQLAKQYSVRYVVVEVNHGINMAYIFNHVAVETAMDENTVLYDDKLYYYYNSVVSRPENVILHCPEIFATKQIVEYRY